MDEGFAGAVEDAVARIERTTDAELVVVAAARSGSYVDVAMIAASVASILLLAAIVFLPFDFHPAFVVVEMAVAWPILAWAFHQRAFLALVTPAARRARQVREAAEAEFVREAVHGTPNRSGILVYLSAFEDRVEVIPDLGVQGLIPPGELSAAITGIPCDPAGFVAGLDRLGALLAKRVPHTAASDDVDLPNAPRIRS
jgi:putative membrane protein